VYVVASYRCRNTRFKTIVATTDRTMLVASGM
jgi:hypothetical protein